MSLGNDVAKAINVFRLLGKNVNRSRQKILAEAAKPMVDAGKNAAPKSSGPHKRYAAAKGGRAAKGKGLVAATYHPGNLGRSIQVMRFRTAKSKVFVGARFQKRGSATGDFKGRRVDGWYLHFVEQGTRKSRPSPFWVAAYMGTKATVEKNVVEGFRRIVQQYNNNG